MNLLHLVRLVVTIAATALMSLMSGRSGSSGQWVSRPSAGARVVAQGCTVDAQVANALSLLTPQQQLGQLFMVGLSSDAGSGVSDTVAAITQLHAGNVVLYGTGWSSAALVTAVTARLAATAGAANAGVAPFISGNQEGGRQGSLQAFYGPGFSAIPAAFRQPAAASNDPGTLEQMAAGWGQELLAAGVNLDLAPVLDTVPPDLLATNAPIGSLEREFGTDPATVAAFGVAFERGMRDAGVAVALKHFPGLGRVIGNTDFTAVGIVDDAFSGLGDPYLNPYKAGIDAGADFVMVSSAIYPQVDTGRAMFSHRIVTDILRNGLGFQNVIITDDVGAAAAVADLSPAERAVRFFRAGGDMVLTILPSDVAPMQQAVQDEMAADPAFAQQIQASVVRVLRVKALHGLLPGCS